MAGLSMGGYGALSSALTHPERFAATAHLSGALDVVGLAGTGGADRAVGADLRRVPGPGEDLHALLPRADCGRPPAGVHLCGTEDP